MRRTWCALLLLLLTLCAVRCNCASVRQQQYDTTPDDEGEDVQGGEYPPQ